VAIGNGENVVIEVVLDDGTVEKTFSRIRKAGKRTGVGLSKGLARANVGLANIAKNAALAGTAVAGIFTGLSIRAAIQQEEAVNSVNQALASAGRFSEEASRDFQNFASELQQVSTIGDETTLELLSLASTFASTNDQAKELTTAAVELAAATGRDANAALIQLGKTLGGTAGELAEVVPATKELTKEQLLAGDAIQLVANRFAGSAQGATRTFAGAFTQLTNAAGDALELFGDFIIKSPALVGVFNELTSVFGTAQDALREFGGSGDVFKPVLLNIISFAQAFNQFIVAPIEIGTKAINSFVSLAAAGILKVSQLATNFASGVLSLLGQGDLAQSLNEQATLLGQGAALNFQDGITKNLGAGLSEDIDSFLLQLQRAAETAGEAGAETGRKFTNNLKTGLDNAKSATSKGSQEILQIVQSTLVAGISASMVEVGRQLAQGGLSFEALGSVVLSSLGDLLIAIGTQIVATSKAITALAAALANPFTAPVALVAGLGLIAAGGFLKSAAGGGGATTPGGLTPQPGTPGGVPIQTNPTGSDAAADTFQESANQAQEAQTQVNVNIQGDVLDSDDTGLRIVDILNNAFDKQGIVVRGGAIA